MNPSSQRPSSTVAHLVDLVREVVPPMHPAGRPFVLAGAAGTLLLRRLSPRLGLVGGVLTAATAWFFREPKRVTPLRAGIAVAPADGTVSEVTEAVAPPELGLDRPMLRISVFLSVFDVHVQRAPATAEVLRRVYRPGKFLSADLDKASEENERNTLLLRTMEDGHEIVVVQIAGLVARRIVCEPAEGDKVVAGNTYGLIRFGSRVDLYVPPGSRVLVTPGQRTIGGETVLAELPEKSALSETTEG